MAHARKQIRDALKTLLTSLTTTGANVFIEHPESFDDSELPCLLIETLEDGRNDDYGSSTTLAHNLVIRIIAHVKQASGAQDKCDLIAVEIYDAIITDDTLSGKCEPLLWQDDSIEYTADLEQDLWTLTSTWACLYWTDPTDPETIRP